MIIQSGSIDITNLKTSNENVKNYVEYFKQQAIISASNLFTAVSNAINANPHLRQVLILKLTPRYDPLSRDPQGMKAALTQIYNNHISELWISSPLKDKISIGNHDLECTGAIRDSRYRYGDKYDGLHMFGNSGRKAYTESVLIILRNSEMIKRSPPNYFRRFHCDQTKPSSNKESLQNAKYASKIVYTCPTQETDYLNDKDIRKNHSKYVYSVPTYNRFSSFNQENY